MTATSGIDRPVTAQALYDNYVKTPGLASDWGYAILTEALEKQVPFDTDAKPDVFAGNVATMSLNASGIDLLALSHQHTDHTVPGRVSARASVC